MPNLPDYELKFTHPQLEGVAVTMGRLTIAQSFELEDIVSMPTPDRAARKAHADALVKFIGEHMVDWNLTGRDGQPLPVGEVTDWLLATQIRDGWLQGVLGTQEPDPLGGAGPDDEFEAEIPVQPLPAPSGGESESAG